jgi:hypothetical protein
VRDEDRQAHQFNHGCFALCTGAFAAMLKSSSDREKKDPKTGAAANSDIITYHWHQIE